MADKPLYPAGHLTVVPVGELGTNCYLLDDGQGGVVVIDPGADPKAILNTAGERPIRLVLATHGHFDHVGAVDAVASLAEQGWALGTLDHKNLAMLTQSARNFGLEAVTVDLIPARTVDQGDSIEVGNLHLHVLAMPGHTPGGVAYIDDAHGLAFTGDTLFAGGAGRTDLPGGDTRALLSSLAVLAKLPPETAVLPGHGPASTIEAELRSNPYLQHALRHSS